MGKRKRITMKQTNLILLFLASILMMGCTSGVIIEYPLQTPCGDNVQSLNMDDSSVEEIIFIGNDKYTIRTLVSCISKFDSVLVLSTNKITGVILQVSGNCYKVPSSKLCSYEENLPSEYQEDGSIVSDGVYVSKSLLIYDFKNEKALYIDSAFREYYKITYETN